MDPIQYHLDPQTLEIFPTTLCNNTRVVFHGTVVSYSEQIEQSGFQRLKSAYDIAQGEALVELLRTPEFSPYDVQQPAISWLPDWPRTVADNIAGYIKAVQHDEYRLSFAILSSDCLNFTNSERKGGQGYVAIRRAKNIIDQALATNPSLIGLIPQQVQDLFAEAKAVENAVGVVYAVEMPLNSDSLEISDDLNTVWSSQPIPASSILAKVIVPLTAEIPQEVLSQSQRLRKQRQQGMLLELGRKRYS